MEDLQISTITLSIMHRYSSKPGILSFTSSTTIFNHDLTFKGASRGHDFDQQYAHDKILQNKLQKHPILRVT